MKPRPVPLRRSFARDVESPARALTGVTVETLGEVSYGPRRYPLLCLRAGAPVASRVPHVLVSAGIHGDEPAGVHAALALLRSVVPMFAHDFCFVVLPCVNPSGYEVDKLETVTGANLNRMFGRGSKVPEVAAIESWLARENQYFRVTFDLHEAGPDYQGEGFDLEDNPDGTFLYETVTDSSRRIGHELVAAVPPDVRVCDWPMIYDDYNDRGVIAYPEACRNAIYAERTSLDAYLNGRYTHHSFTTETLTTWTIEQRVETHLSYLRRALELMRDEPHSGSRDSESIPPGG